MIVTIPGVTTIGGIASDVTYDRDGDVLYVKHGGLIVLTMVNARWFLEKEGKSVVTLPDGSRLETADLGSVLAAA